MTRAARTALMIWAAITLLIAASLFVIYLRLGTDGFGVFVQQPPLINLPVTLASVALLWLSAGALLAVLQSGRLDRSNLLSVGGFFAICWVYLNFLSERFRYGDYTYYFDSAVKMYNNRAVQKNINYLKSIGVNFIGPDVGQLASLITAIGRLSDPEVIFARARQILIGRNDLKGKRVVVSAGPTIEALDPVRYISNHSSGKMGYAVAQAAVETTEADRCVLFQLEQGRLIPIANAGSPSPCPPPTPPSSFPRRTAECHRHARFRDTDAVAAGQRHAQPSRAADRGGPPTVGQPRV